MALYIQTVVAPSVSVSTSRLIETFGGWDSEGSSLPSESQTTKKTISWTENLFFHGKATSIVCYFQKWPSQELWLTYHKNFS